MVEAQRNECMYYEQVEQVLSIVLNHKSPGPYTQKLSQNDISGIFDNFYIPFLSYLESKLNDCPELAKKNVVQFEFDNIIYDALITLKRRLTVIAAKALIIEIHTLKREGKLRGNTGEDRYNSFNDSLLSRSVIMGVLNKYPVLAYLIYVNLEQLINFLLETINNIKKDYLEICSRFDLQSNKVNRMLVGLGDYHNRGRSVLILVLDSGEKIVYKPHEVSVEKAFDNIISWINETGRLRLPLKSANCLTRSGYVWQEYIEGQPCNSEEEVERYYYRSGALLAICHVCKAVDIHSENLIANGEYPIIVDLETLFSNNNPDLYTSNLLSIFFRFLDDSVMGTMMLPQNFTHALFDLDVSGLSGDGGSVSRKIQVNSLVNVGTDNIRIDKVYYSSAKFKNRVNLAGEQISPLNYSKDIEEGFADCYRLIMNNKEEFLELVDYFAQTEMKFRQVLRPTHIYQKFLDSSCHPKYLQSFKDRSGLLDMFNRETEVSAHNQLKIKTQAEITDLFNNDIPYFMADFASTSIYISTGQCIPHYFERGLVDILAERIERMSDKEMTKQLSLIKMSLQTTSTGMWREHVQNQGTVVHRISAKGGAFLELASSIGDYLFDNAIWDSNTTSCTWLTLLIADGEKFKMAPLNYSIYEGSGAILFLACLGAETKNMKYTSLARSALAGVEFMYHPHTLKQGVELPVSAFWGLGSLVYLYYNLAVLWKDDMLYAKYREYLDKLRDYQCPEQEIVDFLGGLAGIVAMLTNLYKKKKDPVIIETAKKYGHVLFQKVRTSPGKLTGLSHGYAGVSWALISLGRIVNNSEFIACGFDLIDKENSYYDKDKNNWQDLREHQRGGDPVFWCHGAAGIGLARAALAADVPEGGKRELLNRDVKAAVAKIKSDGFAEELNYCLCHGLFGNMDIMLKIAEYQQDDDLKEEVRIIADKALSKLSSTGLPFHSLGFMLGLSGLGYAFLRLSNEKLPSVLSLDLMSNGDKGCLHV
jgi:type 2 lantibiotic biosynthesis protein LanM